MRILKLAGSYFALVFGAGFALGAIRILWLVPRIGVRAAELVESPLMLLVTVAAACWISRHRGRHLGPGARLAAGLIALAFLLAAEISLSLILRGGSVQAILLDKDPISGTVYYILLGIYALMPWLLGAKRQILGRA